MKRFLVCFAAVALLGGCLRIEWAREPLASEVIGPAGGRIEAPGIVFDVPAGALPNAEQIAIFEADAPDDRLRVVSSVYRFEPDGLVFDRPPTITFATEGDAAATVLWSRPGTDTEFDVIGTASGGVATAPVAHFSLGFAASECRPRCHCAANEGVAQTLCPSNPGDPEARCADEEMQVAPTAENACALNPDVPCAGYALQTVEAVLCGCTANVPSLGNTPTPTSLCRRPWTRVGTSNSWYCETDLEGNAPTSPDDSYGTTAWKQSEVSCQGYWLDQRNSQMSSNSGPVGGALTDCDTAPRAIGSEWRSFAGTLVCDWVQTDAGEPVVCSSAVRGEFIHYPPRTQEAREAAQQVVDAMNAQGLSTDTRSAVAVFTHADGTVSVGYSRQGPDLQVARELNRRLNRDLRAPRYFIYSGGEEGIDPSHLCGIQNTPGVCAEPRAASAARARSTDGRGSPITGFDVRTRRADNPHPFTGTNADCSAPEPNQMDACPTCGHEANVDRYVRWANGIE